MQSKLLKLLIVTDTHHCSRTPRTAYSNALNFAQDNKADYVMLLGDFADINDREFKRQFFEELSSISSRPRLLACPGNHDVDQKRINDRTKTIHSLLKSNRRLNRYQERLFIDPVKKSPHLAETFEFINGLCENQFSNAFWSIHDDPDNQVQFIVLNSSYFCRFPSSDDEEVVGIPEQILATLDEKIRADRTKIVLMHHPIEKFYRTSELPLKTAFENFCSRNADFVIFGDEHYQLSGSNETIGNKYFVLKSMPFSSRDADQRGMTMLEIPLCAPSEFRLTHYENKINSFPIYSSFGENGFHFPSVESRSRWKHLDNDPSTRIACMDMSSIASLKEELTNLICPDLARAKKATAEFNVAVLDDNGKPTVFGCTDVADSVLENKSTVILAPKDTGLTTLGHLVAQNIADDITGHGLLPCYVDCREITRGDQSRLRRKIYQGRPVPSFSEKNINTLLEREQTVIIFDGINDENRGLIEWIDQCLPQNVHRLFLITENASRSFKIDEENLESYGADKSFVMWPLNMGQVQSFIRDFYPGQDLAFWESRRGKVVEAFKILNEPRYPAFVENVLHVLNRDPDFKFTSKYEAIGKSIDARLGRRHDVFVTSASAIDYETKKLMLGFVCSEIVRLHISDFDENQWNAWIEQFSENRDLPLNPRELLIEFLDVGILIQRWGKSITFRSDYIFYYFISIWMYEDNEFYDFVLDEKNIFKYHEAVLYFIADKSKHKIDILEIVREHLSTLADKISDQYAENGSSLDRGMLEMQVAVVESSLHSDTTGYIAAAEELSDKELLDSDKATAAEHAVAGTGAYFGVTKKPDIHANEARFLALLRTYSKSLRFIGNRESKYKQRHLRSLFDNAWIMANIVAQKKQHLLESNFYVDEGIAYLNFGSNTDFDNPETELFFRILNSITHNITNYAASSQLVKSLDQIDHDRNSFLSHWKRCFLLETCDQSLFPQFLKDWEADQNVYTRFHVARHVVRLAERYAYDEQKFRAFKQLNGDIIRSVRKLEPGLVAGKKLNKKAQELEKREYHLMSNKLANLSVRVEADQDET